MRLLPLIKTVNEKILAVGRWLFEKEHVHGGADLIIYSIHHVLVLRLLINYKVESVEMLHNLLFLVGAIRNEEEDIAFYDYIRTRNGAYSKSLERIVDELKSEKLMEEKEDHLWITEKGRDVYKNMGGVLYSFSSFCDLCLDIMEHCQGDAQKIRERVFYHITFRRAKIGECIFDQCYF